MSGSGCEVFKGPEAILEGVMRLLDSELDVVVIRRLLKPRVARRMTDDLAANAALLRQAVPQMVAVDAFISDWWQRNGYADYRLATAQILSALPKRGGVTIHCDEDEFMDGLDSPHLIFGPLSMSIGASRTGAVIGAERTRSHWFGPDRRYNGTGLTEYIASEHHPERAGRELRTQVPQRCGDAVLFAGHPIPAWHEVKANDKRRAQFFEYCLLHESVTTSMLA